MAKITRRNFVEGAVAASALVLAGCASDSGSDAGSAAAAASVEHTAADYPLEPEEWGSGTVLYTTENTGEGWTRVTNQDGATLGCADEAKLIQVDGYAFKDLDGDGKLSLWEDWRQDTTARAEDLAKQMDVSLELRQMVSGSFRSSDSEGASMGGSSSEFSDDQKKDIDEGYTNRIMMTFTTAPAQYVPWFNEMQAYAESKNYGIPVVFECEAFLGMAAMGIGGTLWPSSPALAATFDKETVRQMADDLSTVIRGFGGTKPNSPQTDVGTEPTWDRNSGTWSDDPALSRDMANGFISGCQSTYDENGNDLGWGIHSVLCNMKHFPGDGAAQFGGNSHNRDGRFDIYPNDNFRANWVPFTDGALQLDSKTGQCASAMPYYSIPYSDSEEYGELVGGGFSKYIMSVGRAAGFEGMYSSDWGIIGQRPWGVENLSDAEKLAKSYEAGMCLMIDDGAYDLLDDAYEIMKTNMGEDKAEARVRDATMRISRTTMNLGLFENPYLTVDQCKEDTDTSKYADFLAETLRKGIVMLKNDGVIGDDFMADKPKVYVPLKYSSGGGGGVFGFMVSEDTGASADLPIDEEMLSEYFTVVTDEVGEPTGDPVAADSDADVAGFAMGGAPTEGGDGAEGGDAPEGAPEGDAEAAEPEKTLLESDIIRATGDALDGVKYGLVIIDGPSTSGMSAGDEESGYAPRSLQYREFTADAESGCPEEGIAGVDASQSEYENLSPFGNSVSASNEGDLDMVIMANEALPEDAKLIVVVKTNNPVMCWHELEPYADAILWTNCSSDDAILDVACGKFEPSGLLPWQQPKDMSDCYKTATDTPRDLECYTDSMGNKYDFAFGLNWSGVIDDERVATYKVDPLLAPEMTIDDSLLGDISDFLEA